MKNLFNLLAFCTCITAFAQINFEPGYFINNNGTKTECLIKNVAWKNNPLSFEYRLSESSPAETAGIKDISEFSVSGYRFVRYTIKIDRSTRDIHNMKESSAPTFKEEMLYLNVLVEGKAVLYMYEDGNIVRYFYSGGDKNTVAEQLVFKEYLNNGNIATNTTYRGQLYNALQSNIPDKNAYKNIKYNKEQLVKLFLKYNNAQGGEVTDHTQSQNKAKINLKLTAGANLSSLSLYDSDNVAGANDFPKKVTGRFGAEVEVLLPFNNQKWAFFADPAYYSYESNSKRWILKQKGIELPLGARYYMHVTNKTKLFVNAAYVISLPFGKSHLISTYNAENNINQSMAEVAKSSNFAFGAGIGYNKISAELRYSTNRQLLPNYSYWGGDYSTIGIILSYNFL